MSQRRPLLHGQKRTISSLVAGSLSMWCMASWPKIRGENGSSVVCPCSGSVQLMMDCEAQLAIVFFEM